MANHQAVSGIKLSETYSLRQRLREDTRQLHEAVDTKFGSQDLQTVSGLSAFLGAQFVAYSTIAHCFVGLRHVLQPRIEHLKEDLTALGTPLPEHNSEKLEGSPQADGVLYVLLGSQMGARVLRRHWQKSTDARVLQAGRFLSDDSLAQTWQEFVRHCSAQPAIGEMADQIVRSAQATFSIFLNGFDAVVGPSGDRREHV